MVLSCHSRCNNEEYTEFMPDFRTGEYENSIKERADVLIGMDICKGTLPIVLYAVVGCCDRNCLFSHFACDMMP